jgi:signal transduction histidine kinase
LLLRDQRWVEAAERDLAMASQMHSVARLYRAMAHDLRAPLNTMVVNLELLADAVATDGGRRSPAGGDPGERRRRYVRVLKEETERLSRQLLAFLSQTAPPRDAERPVDLGALVEEMALFVRPQASQQGTELRVELPAEPVRVPGNPDRLRQALLSLVVNALEAVAGDAGGRASPGGGAERGRTGGRVEIAVAIEGRGEAARAALTVRDDGPGVPPQIADRLFDLHVSSKAEGSGIGLTVARRIAERHGGSLDVVPVEPPGACFRLALPLPAATETSSSPETTSAPPHQEA